MRKRFTPAPWTIEEYGDDECPALVIHKDTGSRVCFMATPGSRGDPEQIEADAHLIAAAPEMYEALERLTKDIEPRDLTHYHADWKSALKALAKARGER